MKKRIILSFLCCGLIFGALPGHAATARLKDSTQMNLSAINAVTAKPIGGIPVGTVIAWPVANNPEDGDKWLECNGQSISASVYPELFALVGGSVPDFRGLFLRENGGNSAALGQAQGDAIRNITGGGPSTAFTNTSDGDSGALRTVRWQYGHDWFGKWGGSGFVGGLILDASRVVPTAKENRPVNKSVRYFVRALP